MKKNEFMERTMVSKSQVPNPNEIPSPNSQSGRKPYDLRERTFEFAVRMLAVAAAVPMVGYSKMIAGQLSRSGPSVGANVEEAHGAVSKADKRRAFVIARKEVRETRYWLRLIDRLLGPELPVREDIQEATELLYILSAIIGKLE